MKKFLLLWVLGLAILAGCAQQGLSQSELFEKKQECIKYKEGLQKEIDKEVKRVENFWDWSYESDVITEIFYSNKENTCFALTSETMILSNGNQFNYSKIINLLTNEEVSYSDDNIDRYYERLNAIK